MNTAPETEHTGKGKPPEPVTRLDRMKAERRDIVLPDNPAPHLTDWFLEIGPASGDGPLGWQDIAAWSAQIGVELDPWETRTLRRLSEAFVNQRAVARKPNCPEPRLQADEIATRNKVDAQFAALMGALKTASPKEEP